MVFISSGHSVRIWRVLNQGVQLEFSLFGNHSGSQKFWCQKPWKSSAPTTFIPKAAPKPMQKKVHKTSLTILSQGCGKVIKMMKLHCLDFFSPAQPQITLFGLFLTCSISSLRSIAPSARPLRKLKMWVTQETPEISLMTLTDFLCFYDPKMVALTQNETTTKRVTDKIHPHQYLHSVEDLPYQSPRCYICDRLQSQTPFLKSNRKMKHASMAVFSHLQWGGSLSAWGSGESDHRRPAEASDSRFNNCNDFHHHSLWVPVFYEHDAVLLPVHEYSGKTGT